jgi:hypothetical protein
MKNILFALSIILISTLFFGCPNPTSTGPSPGPETKATWTILIHFAIDNNIDYEFEKTYGIVTDYLTTLESIEASDAFNKIQILVLMDCYNNDINGNGYATTFSDGYYHLTGGNFNDDISIDITEINSGDVDETKSFMDWAVSNYPSDGYFYSVFNHGSGFDDQNIEGTYGIGFDDNSSDCLSHYELGQTTAYLKQKIGHNVDIFYAYACLMGGVELSYELRNNANYLLFSEELFPADLWSYEALDYVISNTSITAIDLGKAFCDSAYDYFSGLAIPKGFTLSLIDLSKVNQLYTSLDGYASSALSDINSNSSQGAFNTAAHASFSMLSLYGINDYYYMDLGDYLDNIIVSSGISTNVKNSANSVKSSLSSCVVYKRGYSYPKASGLTIFHNIWNSTYQYPPATYEAILTFGTNTWADYIVKMDSSIEAPEEDAYEPDDDPASATQIIIGEAAQSHTIDVYTDVDWVYFPGVSGTDYTISCYGIADILDMYLYEEGDYTTSIDSGYIGNPIVFSCTESVNYYVKIESYDNRVGDYSIDLQTGLFKGRIEDTGRKKR